MVYHVARILMADIKVHIRAILSSLVPVSLALRIV
jgi:hypothetical protein